eukprot:gb/GECG01016742.1/.p1 GENE.gb/GECG01016742.1/~~gb/GECG01016742.1/.p1  ORF type:complete len:110 (+),score=27.96 gb/GECG01016742.1/:1-330(+)
MSDLRTTTEALLHRLLSRYETLLDHAKVDWQHHTSELNMFRVESTADAITDDVEQLLSLIHDLKVQRIADLSRYYHALKKDEQQATEGGGQDEQWEDDDDDDDEDEEEG